jgi:hypothetical protein
MRAPDVWSDQGRALTVEDMENMPDDEFRYELDDGVLIVSPALTVVELGSGRYQQVARVAGDEAFEAALPFPVSVTPSALVRTGPLT